MPKKKEQPKITIPKKINVHWIDVEELAIKVLGVEEKYESGEVDSSDIEDLIYEKFDCSMETFENIVSHLMPYTVLSKSDLSDSLRIGFVDHTEGIYVVKAELK